MEIMFPVEDEDLEKEVMHILEIQLADNMKARELTPENVYERIDRRGKVLLGAQSYFCEEAARRAKPPKKTAVSRRFIPAEPVEE